MIDFKPIDELARRLSELVPPGLREQGDELQQAFRGALQAGLSKLDLVTREEFEVQRAVLMRTREKLEALERAVAALEAERAGTPPTNPSFQVMNGKASRSRSMSVTWLSSWRLLGPDNVSVA